MIYYLISAAIVISTLSFLGGYILAFYDTVKIYNQINPLSMGKNLGRRKLDKKGA